MCIESFVYERTPASLVRYKLDKNSNLVFYVRGVLDVGVLSKAVLH